MLALFELNALMRQYDVAVLQRVGFCHDGIYHARQDICRDAGASQYLRKYSILPIPVGSLVERGKEGRGRETAGLKS